MPSRLLECQKGNQLKTTRWEFHFRSQVGAPHANFTHSQPVSNKWDLQLLQPPNSITSRRSTRGRASSASAVFRVLAACVPANTPALGNLFDPFIFGDEGQSAELITS
jgi:hypothetical protein